ncbi:MAG: enoyl-CoA hydratase/isomerase family protein [Candidatus Thorarchaeota archaeon]|jgi:enoyl-CoA hydratase
MMSEQEVLFSVSDGVATITINRPEKYNALNSSVVKMLFEFFQKAEEDETVRVVVLTGAGEKAFAAGADINEFKGKDSKSIRERVERGQAFTKYMESMSKPIIAAINGFALGGGCEFAMACDIRYASSNAKLGQPEILLGIIPGYGGSVRLPRLVGLGRAKELVFTGEQIPAEEAFRIGLVNKVFETVDDLRVGVDKLAAKLTRMPGVAIKLAKQVLNNSWSMSLGDNLAFELEVFCQTFDTEDKDIGVDAFLSKGKPEFKHK